MDAYIELLKEFYYKELCKLQQMQVFKQEGRLRFLENKKEMLDKARDNLSLSQLLGRSDITEEAKDNLLGDRDNADKVHKYLNQAIENEFRDVEKQIEEESNSAQYSCNDYAEYLLQLEKVSAIEGELENNRLFPEAVYEEQRLIAEGKNKTGGGE
jgi:hypothetical protein